MDLVAGRGRSRRDRVGGGRRGGRVGHGGVSYSGVGYSGRGRAGRGRGVFGRSTGDEQAYGQKSGDEHQPGAMKKGLHHVTSFCVPRWSLPLSQGFSLDPENEHEYSLI